MFKALCFVALAAFVAFGATLFVATNGMAGKAAPAAIAAEPGAVPADAAQRTGPKTATATKKSSTRKKNASPTSISSEVKPGTQARSASDPQPLV